MDHVINYKCCYTYLLHCTVVLWHTNIMLFKESVGRRNKCLSTISLHEEKGDRVIGKASTEGRQSSKPEKAQTTGSLLLWHEMVAVCYFV